MGAIRLDFEQQLEAAEAKRVADLERIRLELSGSADEAMAARMAREKEERAELLRRQMVRRMMSQGRILPETRTLVFQCRRSSRLLHPPLFPKGQSSSPS